MDPKMAALKRLQAQEEEGGVAPAVAPMPPSVDQASLMELLSALGGKAVGGLKDMAGLPAEAVAGVDKMLGGKPKLTVKQESVTVSPPAPPESVSLLKKPFNKNKRITREEE